MEEKVIESLSFSVVKPEHADKWVAIAKESGKLVGAGETLSEVLHKSAGVKEKTVFKALPTAFAGGGLR